MLEIFRALKTRRKTGLESRFRSERKSLPQDLESDVSATIVRVRPFTMTSVERMAALCDAVKYVYHQHIAGAIVECGVWKGGSMMAVAETLIRLGDQSRDLYLFDTFDGMTAPSEHDVAITGERACDLLGRQSREDPTSVWCVASVDEVQRNMATTGYPRQRLHFVPGRVEDTLPAAAPPTIALLRLDTDWYESTRQEMEHLFPRLSPGGVFLIDDYGHWRGARRAVDDYFRRHQISMLLNRIDYTGRIGVFHPSIRAPGEPAVA